MSDPYIGFLALAIIIGLAGGVALSGILLQLKLLLELIKM
jgi:hypothetical protein